MPVALLLVRANATVTICHSRSRRIWQISAAAADVLVAAVGRPEMVRGDWVKPGAVVIDVGINRVEDATRPKGYRLVGDVAYDEVKEVAGSDHPRSRRGRSDDHRHAAAQYPAEQPNCADA